MIPDAEEPPFDATGQQNALNRRPVGEDDKETTLQQAKAKLASTKNGFMVVMRSTYVSKKFHMVNIFVVSCSSTGKAF